MTKRSLRVLVTMLSFAAGSLSGGTSAAPGFLEGNLSIHSERGANLADQPTPAPDQTSYKDYPLAVFSKDHRTEVAEISVDEHGHYRLPLPPGDYVLDLKRRVHNRLRVAARPFTITSQQTALVNMEIDSAFPPPM
jgi:hypothetical protein